MTNAQIAIQPGMPKSYVNAKPLTATRMDPATGRIGLAFTLENGSVVRVAVLLDDIGWLLQGMLFNIESQIEKLSEVQGRTYRIFHGMPPLVEPVRDEIQRVSHIHSKTSSGNPNSDVSTEP